MLDIEFKSKQVFKTIRSQRNVIRLIVNTTF